MVPRTRSHSAPLRLTAVTSSRSLGRMPSAASGLRRDRRPQQGPFSESSVGRQGAGGRNRRVAHPGTERQASRCSS
jgi:hypothetical protein